MAELVASWTNRGTRFTVYAEEQFPPSVRSQANRRDVAPAGHPEPETEPHSRSPRRDVAVGSRHRDASRSTPGSTSEQPVDAGQRERSYSNCTSCGVGNVRMRQNMYLCTPCWSAMTVEQQEDAWRAANPGQ